MLTTPMLTTVDAVLPWLEGASAADTPAIERLIRAASSRIETFLGRKLRLGERRQSFALSRPQACLLLSDWPILGISSFSVDGVALNPATLVFLDGGLLKPLGKDWPSGAYSVQYTAGYILPDRPGSDLPAEIEEAAILAVRAVWCERQRDPRLKSVDIPEVERREFWFGGLGPGALPSEVLQRLAPYRAPAL